MPARYDPPGVPYTTGRPVACCPMLPCSIADADIVIVLSFWTGGSVIRALRSASAVAGQFIALGVGCQYLAAKVQ